MSRLCVLLALFGALVGCAQTMDRAPTDSRDEAMQPAEAAETIAAEEALGVKVEVLRLTGAGYMLDFRYHVLDSEKSRPLVDRSLHPYLVHKATGAYLGIPAPSKIGALRQTPRSHHPDRTYFMLFANPAGLVKAGDTVDIVVGEYQFEGLIVE